MKLNASKFGLASAIVFAVVWVLCSLFVYAMPVGMMQTTGHMVHGDFARMSWQLNGTGFFFGLIAWPLLAGITAWAIAATYNLLIGKDKANGGN